MRMQDLATEAVRVVSAVAQRITDSGMNPAIVTTAPDGDIVTSADRVADDAARAALHASPLRCRLLTEQSGNIEDLHANPDWLIVLDELDGSRPARLGSSFRPLSSVSMAVLPQGDDPIVANVVCAVVQSLDGDCYLAIRGQGVLKNGRPLSPIRTRCPTINDGIVMLDHAGHSLALAGLYHELFSPTRLNGLFFFSSSSCAARQLLDGKIDAHSHLAARLYRTWPQLRNYITDTSGSPKGMMPYDLAAYYLLLREAGCTVTDSYGSSLENVRLDDITPNNQRCVISARDPKLHQYIIHQLDRTERLLLSHQSQIELLVEQLGMLRR